MKKLQGTEKQIAYASTVREYVLNQLDNLNRPEIEDKKKELIKTIERQQKADIILKSFVTAFKTKSVRSQAIDFLTYNDKFTQKELKNFSGTAVTIEALKDVECEVKYNKVESKKEVKQEEKATNKQKSYLEKLLSNIDMSKLKMQYVSTEIEMFLSEAKSENLLLDRASYLIDILRDFQKSNFETSTVNYFTSKYDTFDCETSECIEAGEMVWRDEEGIHRADNY